MLGPVKYRFRHRAWRWAPNWTIRMAWLGDERGYLSGVKRADLVTLDRAAATLYRIWRRLLYDGARADMSHYMTTHGRLVHQTSGQRERVERAPF
jgi:hypothetical protein